jgi:hypothetical protein
MEKSHYFIYRLPKAVIALLAMIVLVSGCSAPKYTASFTRGPAAKLAEAKAPAAEPVVEGLELAVVMEEAAIAPEVLTASISENVVVDNKTAQLAMLNEALEKVKANPEAAAPKKMTFAQKLVAKKVAKKLERVFEGKKVNNVDSIEQSDRRGGWGGLITGLILLLAGIILQAILPAGVAIIGTIVWIAGVVALVLWLLRFLGVL